jgi:hypothetical protein
MIFQERRPLRSASETLDLYFSALMVRYDLHKCISDILRSGQFVMDGAHRPQFWHVDISTHISIFRAET